MSPKIAGSLLLSTIFIQASAADVLSIAPITPRVVMIHVSEGKVEHHKKGQKHNDDKVIISELDVAKASQTGSYVIDGPGLESMNPVKVGRKSKGADYAWYVDSWENNRAVNRRPDHVKEHWIYLNLAKPLVHGKTYEVSTGSLFGAAKKHKFTAGFERSESLHVNLVGYSPSAPQKFGYIYHWAGDQGAIDFSSFVGKEFSLIDSAGAKAFRGKISLRYLRTQQETYHASDSPPNGNFSGADVYDCDFSSFDKPGSYRLQVEGIGTSFPFEIKADVYREVFYHTTRALYHNRSGIALTKPFTTFERPAPHHPTLTPGFKGKLQYCSLSNYDSANQESGQGSEEQIKKSLKGPLDAWGWYQDAGDWDSYSSHLRVSRDLMLAYLIAPGNFKDGELNIPESGNGIPDILDEAMWLPRFCHRLRKELLAKNYGTGGISLRVCGDMFGPDGEGVPSYEDVNRTWIVAGEEAVSTMAYAGSAALIAELLGEKKDSVDWKKEAIESYDWAMKNAKPKLADELKSVRSFAAAALFRLTGESKYSSQFRSETLQFQPTSVIRGDDIYGPSLWVLAGGKIRSDKELTMRLKEAILSTGKEMGLKNSAKRSMRWGGPFDFPMLVGQQSTPWVLDVAVAWAVAKETDAELAKSLRASLYTTCDYFLGTNSLNMTYVTGVGERFPTAVFHLDSFCRGSFHPGIIPYAHWRKEQDFGNGPWSQFWAYKTLYPGISAWPGNEQWFSNRNSPMGSEFTIHQNIGPAAAIFGVLCAPNN